MEKLVYLFELDSARTSPAEIETGQNALLRQLALGNYVVLTYNQLADSPAFLACVYNKELFNQVVGLFENGILCISHWASEGEMIRSPSQYVQNAIQRAIDENDDAFVFASLPSVKRKTPFLQLISEALRTGNPYLVREYRDKGLGINVNNAAFDPLEGISEKDVDYLIRYLDLVLRLSRNNTLGIAPYYNPNGPTMEALIENALGAIDYLAKESSTSPEGADALDPIRKLWPKTNAILSKLLEQLRSNGTANQRSAWHKRLSELQNANSEPCKLADVFIDLCYNFASKYSISPAFHSLYDEQLFAAELLEKLLSYWQDVLDGRHECFRKGSGDHHNMANYSLNSDWEDVIGLRSLETRRPDMPKLEDGTGGMRETKSWAKEYRMRSRRAFRFALLCMIVCFFFDLIFDILPEIPSYLNVGRTALETDDASLLLPYVLGYTILQALRLVPKTLIFGAIAAVIANLCHIPDIPVSAKSIRRAISERRMISRIEKQEKEHHSQKNGDAIRWSNLLKDRHSAQHKVLEPSEFKLRIDSYLQFAEKHPELFANDVPFPTILDRSKLLEYETTHPEARFGIRYQSDYSILLVDLLNAGENECIVYERIVPAVPKGAVIIVPVQGDQYILLRQYRHAVQQYQLSFPRGFGKPGLSVEENAVKEIMEETGATVIHAEALGEVALNNGLEGGSTSVVSCLIRDIRSRPKSWCNGRFASGIIS